MVYLLVCGFIGMFAILYLYAIGNDWQRPPPPTTTNTGWDVFIVCVPCFNCQYLKTLNADTFSRRIIIVTLAAFTILATNYYQTYLLNSLLITMPPRLLFPADLAAQVERRRLRIMFDIQGDMAEQLIHTSTSPILRRFSEALSKNAPIYKSDFADDVTTPYLDVIRNESVAYIDDIKWLEDQSLAKMT